MLTLSAPHGGGHHHHGGGGGGFYRGGYGFGPGYYYPPAPEVIVVQTDCVRDNTDVTRCCPQNAIVNGACTLPARRRLFGFRGAALGGVSGMQLLGLGLVGWGLIGLVRRTRRRRRR